MNSRNKNHYYIIFKPFGMLSQFTPACGNPSLSDLNFKFPRDIYPVGRLDKESEGLLILTNDRKVNHHLLNPKFKHTREYLVQVEGIPDDEALEKLRRGIIIDGKKTLPAEVSVIDEPVNLPVRVPPVRFRRNIPISWLSICLREGRNRQVRKMTARTGYPTLRLIRRRIEKIGLGNLIPGEVKELSGSEIFSLLNLSL